MMKAQKTLVALLLRGSRSSRYIRVEEVPHSEPTRYRVVFSLEEENAPGKTGCDVWDFIEFAQIMAKATLSETKDPKLLYALKFLERALKFSPYKPPKKKKKSI